MKEFAMTNDFSPSSRPVSISFQEYRDEEIVDFFANENRTFHPENAGSNFGRARLVGAPSDKRRSPQQKGTAAFHISFPGTEGEKNAIDMGTPREETTIPLPVELLEAAPDVLAATIHEAPKKKKDFRSEPSLGKSTRPLASILRSRISVQKQAAAVIDDPLARRDAERPKSIPTHNRPILIARLEDAILPMPGLAKRMEAELAAEPEKGVEDATPEILSPEERILDRLRETDQQLGRLIESWPRLPDRLKETIAALIDVAEKEEEEDPPIG